MANGVRFRGGVMRWKGETQELINTIPDLKHNILIKIHGHGVEGPGYPMMPKSYADLITGFYETHGSRKSSNQRKFLGPTASMRTVWFQQP